MIDKEKFRALLRARIDNEAAIEAGAILRTGD